MKRTRDIGTHLRRLSAMDIVLDGWLAETAKSVRYKVSEAFNTSKPKTKSKGSKGKKNNRNGSKAGGGNRYLIKVSDFVPFAEAIAKNETTVMLPVALTGLQAATGPQIGATPDAIPLENHFAHLTVEDIAEIAEEEGLSEEDLPEVTKIVFEQNDAELEEELKFAIALFLQELQGLCDPACAQWKKYKAGEVGLIVASMATDLAIRLAQKAEADFDFSVTQPKRFPADTYPVWTLLDVLTKPSQPATETDNVAYNFWPTYIGLKYYFNRMLKWDEKKSLPATVPKDFGDRQQLDYTLRAIKFAQVVRISMFGKHPDVWDLASQSIEHMLQTRKLSVWVTFAVELLFQAQDLVGKPSGQPYFELANHLNKLVRQNNKVMQDWYSPFLPSEIVYDVFETLGMTLQQCQQWVMFEDLEKQWESMTQNKQVASHLVLKKMRKKNNYFLSSNPILCGMLKYEMYLKYQAAGMKLEDQSLAIVTMAHLYTIGRLEAFSQTRDNMPNWPDMEFALHAQDDA
ncbi:hypothetical protein CC86DRAFT_411156 [Ophiobolus disseminans]|uniref:DUF6604 domain-containing protein n=1 Tax=Ophiobolus disseminans TaxID=1469910 RepID=A0A6A6ZMJ1_9PLEO|nr:hypothetical protein CC86DRAFT_411156 [Ophiobolus disseminans]